MARYRPHVELQYIISGNIKTPRPEKSLSDGKPVVQCRLWDLNPDVAPLPIVARRQGPEVGELVTRLNGLLYQDVLSWLEEKELECLLQNVMPPLLRILAANYLLAEK